MNTKIASQIRVLIKKSNHILLSLHPSPDPDSLGSNLALYQYLTSIGKKVDLIKGDSDIKTSLSVFPGLNQIISKNITEIKISNYDLYIILDVSGNSQITKLIDPSESLSKIKSINIDHHPNNTLICDLKLVNLKSTSTCELLYDLFRKWHVKLTADIATNLLFGIYSDTGSFCNINTTSESIKKFAILSKYISNFQNLMFEYRNSRTKDDLDFIKLALNKYQTFFSSQVAISAISLADFKKSGLDPKFTDKAAVSEYLRTCSNFKITICLTEKVKNDCGISMRSRTNDCDISQIARLFNGNGHKVAAGANILKSPKIAVKMLIEAIHQQFPELGQP